MTHKARPSIAHRRGMVPLRFSTSQIQCVDTAEGCLQGVQQAVVTQFSTGAAPFQACLACSIPEPGILAAPNRRGRSHASHPRVEQSRSCCPHEGQEATAMAQRTTSSSVGSWNRLVGSLVDFSPWSKWSRHTGSPSWSVTSTRYLTMPCTSSGSRRSWQFFHHGQLTPIVVLHTGLVKRPRRCHSSTGPFPGSTNRPAACWDVWATRPSNMVPSKLFRRGRKWSP